MRYRSSILFLPATLLLVALTSCVGPPQAPPAPAPSVIPIPPPSPVPLARDWRDWPVTPGTWRYAADPQGGIARFGSGGGDPVVTLRCDSARRRVVLSRVGSDPAPLTVRTSSTARTLTVAVTGAAPSYVAAALAATDPLLDAMAFTRGRFTIEQAGHEPLAIPAWAEIGRVVEDCRR